MNVYFKKWIIGILLSINVIFISLAIIMFIITNDKLDYLIEILPLQNISQTKTEIKTIPNLPTDNDPYIGSIYAPVKMVMFSDYQCHYCRIFFDSTFNLIRKNYIDKGLVSIYVKNSPRDTISFSYQIAQAALLAFEKGKFWEFHTLVYANQLSLNPVMLNKCLAEVGIDSTNFKEALVRKTYQSIVKGNMEIGSKNEVFGFPAFVINDKLYVGNRDFAAFKVIIDKEINLSLSTFDAFCE